MVIKIPDNEAPFFRHLYEEWWWSLYAKKHNYTLEEFLKTHYDLIIIVDTDSRTQCTRYCFVFESEEDYFAFILKWS